MAQPTANEQELLELINRMRLNPSAELALLLDSTDGDVQYALDYYGVNRATLKSQWSHLTVAAPLAWASELNDSAAGHNQAMIAKKQQAHVLDGELGVQARIAQAGYQSTFFGENVYAAAKSVVFTHTGLAIDWGNGANTIEGIQAPALHRQNLMSPMIREVGISAIEDNHSAPIGPLVCGQTAITALHEWNPRDAEHQPVHRARVRFDCAPAAQDQGKPPVAGLDRPAGARVRRRAPSVTPPQEEPI